MANRTQKSEEMEEKGACGFSSRSFLPTTSQTFCEPSERLIASYTSRRVVGATGSRALLLATTARPSTQSLDFGCEPGLPLLVPMA